MKKSMALLSFLSILTLVLAFSGCEQPASGGGSGGGNPPPVVTYVVGDTGPAGGKIFYVNPNAVADGWTYLEAAPADLTGTFAWDTTTPETIDVTTATAIGSGKTNTDAISTALGDAGAAAKAAKAYAGGGKTDWFLPSKEELTLMYQNLKVNGVGDFVNTGYWSSSQYSTAGAWAEDFNDGGRGDDDKGNAHSVRVVRAF